MNLALVYEKFVSTGGLEGYLFGFAKALLADGHRVRVVTSQTDAGTRALPVALHMVRPPAVPQWARMLRFDRAAAAKLRAMDALDAGIGFGRTTTHDFHRAGGGCHREYARQLPPFKRLTPKHRVELALERRLYSAGGTRHFVVNSAMVAGQLQHHYRLAPERFSIIHTAVDSDAFHPAADDRRRALRRQIAIRPDRPACLFVSMSHRRKGIGALLRAWPRVVAAHDAELWIVGPRLSPVHRRQLSSSGLADRVRVFPPAESVVQYYQAADVFVHPTLYDACANTVMQAMACALPAVVSSRDGAIQFIENGANGWRLDAPDNPRALADAVNSALATPESSRRTVGDAARAKMLPLTWPAHVARWMDVIAAHS